MPASLDNPANSYNTSWLSPAETVTRELEQLVNELNAFLDQNRQKLKGVITRDRETLEKTLKASRTKQEAVKKVRDQIRFLKIVHKRNRERLEKRLAKNRSPFTIVPIKQILSDHPELRKYFPLQYTNQRIMEAFGYDYRGLVAAMGFPVIANVGDETEVRAKISKDLWEKYNRKNGLPSKNRVYTPGHELPKERESTYMVRHYEIYGGFRGAIAEIFVPPKSEIEIKAETMPAKRMNDLLLQSLREGALPEGIGEEKEEVRATLKKELKEAIAFLTIHIVDPSATRTKCHRFNWRQLLFHCPYFGEYGVRIYDLWLGKQRLKEVLCHPDKAIERTLEKAFFEDAPMRHMRKAPSVYEVSDEELDTLSVTGVNLEKISAERIRQTLDFFQKKQITVQPRKKDFLEDPDDQSQGIGSLNAKADFFETHAEIPFYMRQILYAAHMTPVERIQERLAVLQRAGIGLKYAVHFLHVDTEAGLASITRVLQRITEGYESIRASHKARKEKQDPVKKRLDKYEKLRALLLKHLPKSQVPSVETLMKKESGCYTITRRVYGLVAEGRPLTRAVLADNYAEIRQTQREKEREQNQTGAIRELQKMGHPYPSLLIAHRSPIRPEVVLERVRLATALGLPVNKKIISLPAEKISEEAERRQQKQERKKCDEEILRQELARRGLSNPSVEFLKRGTAHCLDRLTYIESRGISFDAEQMEEGVVAWNWFRLSAVKLEPEICFARRQHTHRQEYYKKLEELYGFDRSDLTPPTQKKPPDTLWQYFRLIDQAGLSLKDIRRISDIHQYGLRRFPAYLAQVVQERQEAEKPLNPKQCLLLQQYQVAERAEEEWQWEDAFEILLLLPEKEFQTAAGTLMARQGNTGEAEALHAHLQIRDRQQVEVIRRLCRTEASYPLMNRLLDKYSPEDIFRKITAFDEAKAVLDPNVLHWPTERIMTELKIAV